MLVLSRKIRERIFINDNITVEVIEIQGDRVRLGIVAPKEVKVNREEIHKKIQDSKSSPPTDLPSP